MSVSPLLLLSSFFVLLLLVFSLSLLRSYSLLYRPFPERPPLGIALQIHSHHHQSSPFLPALGRALTPPTIDFSAATKPRVLRFVRACAIVSRVNVFPKNPAIFAQGPSPFDSSSCVSLFLLLLPAQTWRSYTHSVGRPSVTLSVLHAPLPSGLIIDSLEPPRAL